MLEQRLSFKIGEMFGCRIRALARAWELPKFQKDSSNDSRICIKPSWRHVIGCCLPQLFGFGFGFGSSLSLQFML